MIEKELIEFDKSLSVFELLIYVILLKYKRDNLKATLEDIHFETIEYILKNGVKIEGKGDITKTLPKLATFDETTQEWNLKSKVQILQEMRLNYKSKIKMKEIL